MGPGVRRDDVLILVDRKTVIPAQAGPITRSLNRNRNRKEASEKNRSQGFGFLLS
jgi:hypothetical protein